MSIFEKIIADNKEFIDAAWEKLDNKLSIVAQRNYDKLPFTTENGVYNDFSRTVPHAWTNGFWPGMMWLMYVGTKHEEYKNTAIHAEELLEKAAEDFDILFHDVGFMWHISSGVHYRLLGDKKSKSRAMYMAASLSSRFNMNTRAIRAFCEPEREKKVIVDCMMNIPLLYWASKETNDPRFSLVAMAHADTTMNNHVRPDGSVYHILEYDIHTGECLGPIPGQGSGIESSWTRGQAWAIYGFILSYIHTGKKEYLDTAKRVAHYFIACVSQTEYVAQYDFRQDADSKDVDTSASAIAACGLIEIAKIVPENEKKLYLDVAIKMLRAIDDKWCDWSSERDSIVQGVAESPWRLNVDTVFGEYYFIEAIYKLKGFEPLFW